MKFSKLVPLLFLFFILFSGACTEDDAPAGFNADFNFRFQNGGMAPDSVLFFATYPNANEYEWDIEGLLHNGLNTVQFFDSSGGNYKAELTTKIDCCSKTTSTPIRLENYPPGGSALTVIQQDGEVGTIVVRADLDDPNIGLASTPPWTSIGSANEGGVDYDDKNKLVYYANPLVSSAPNGEDISDPLVGYLSSDDAYITDLAIDSDEQKIYYATKKNNGYSGIAKYDLYNYQRTAILNFNSGVIKHLALDEDSNELYFSSESALIYFNDGGSSYEQISTNNCTKVCAMAFDNINNVLYYAGTSGGSIYDIIKYDPANGTHDVVKNEASTDRILGLDIDEKEQLIYWTDQANSLVHCKALSGATNETQVKTYNVDNPRTLAVGNFKE